MKFILGLPLLLKIVVSMRIPQDTESVGGYISIIEQDAAPDDEFYEAKNLVGEPLSHAIRDRRSPIDQLSELPAVHEPLDMSAVAGFDSKLDEISQSPDTDPTNIEYVKNIAYTKLHPPRKQLAALTSSDAGRSKREVENAENATVTETAKETNRTGDESLPSPSKQIMRNSDSIVGYWTQAPSDYSKLNFDEDVSADASTINQGINARAPRVNFITQQRRTIDDDDSSVSATRADIYRNGGMNVNDRIGDRMLAGPPPPRERERYMNREPDPEDFPRRFDRYESSSRYNEEPAPPAPHPPRSYYPPYDRELHPEYYRVHDSFDPYMPRIPTYPDPYYEYPDRRYDTPEPRDYPPIYNNDLDDRFRVMETDRFPPPVGRIIYYEHLPEIGRGPPLDMRYRHRDWDAYYGPYDNNPLLGAYRRPLPPIEHHDQRRDQIPNSGVVKIEDPNDRRQDDRIYYDRDGNGSGNSTSSAPDQESRGYRPADHRSYY